MSETTVHLRPRFSYLIGHLDRMVSQALEQALADEDLSLAQYTMLSILDRRPGLSNAQLARRSLVSPQAMNQAMAEPLRRGLIEREPHPTQGRVLQTTLTDDGREVLAGVDRHVDMVEEQLLATLSAEEQRTLVLALTRVANLDERGRGHEDRNA